MDDKSSESIYMFILTIFFFLMLISAVFLKINEVSSNEAFFSEVHSFKISNIINTLFLDDYFKTSYNLGKLEDVYFNVEKKDNFIFNLKHSSSDYNNILFIPENSEFKFENNPFKDNFEIVKKDNVLTFKTYNKCVDNDVKPLKLEELEDFKIINNNENFNVINIFMKENNKDFCNVYLGIKENYARKKVLLYRLPEDFFEDKIIILN